jgi:hypothetical protein
MVTVGNEPEKGRAHLCWREDQVRSITTGWLLILVAAAGGGCTPTDVTNDGPVLGLGAVEVFVVVTGPVYGTARLNIVLTVNGMDVPSGTVAPTGGRIRLGDLPTGEHQVRLEPVPRGCRVTNGHPRSFQVENGGTSMVTIATDCSIVSSDIFDRVTPYSPGSGFVAQSERFAVRPDGTFVLHYEVLALGPLEASGTWSLAGTAITFAFDWPGYGASGTLLGNCLTVTYDTFMAVDGFEDGEYCR